MRTSTSIVMNKQLRRFMLCSKLYLYSEEEGLLDGNEYCDRATDDEFIFINYVHLSV